MGLLVSTELCCGGGPARPPSAAPRPVSGRAGGARPSQFRARLGLPDVPAAGRPFRGGSQTALQTPSSAGGWCWYLSGPRSSLLCFVISPLQIEVMAGPEADAQFQFTGIKKYFNSYTLTGRMNCVMATYGSIALLILYFKLRSKKTPAVKAT